MLSRILYATAIFKKPPVLLSAEIGYNRMTLVFDVPVNVSGITGMSLSSDSGIIAVSSIDSGGGTDTVLYNLDRIVDAEEVISLTIDKINDIASVSDNVAFKGIVDYSVDINSNIALPYILPFTLTE